MTGLSRSQRTLAVILFSIAAVGLVLLITFVIIYVSSDSKRAVSDSETAATLHIQNTIDAIVSATLQHGNESSDFTTPVVSEGAPASEAESEGTKDASPLDTQNIHETSESISTLTVTAVPTRIPTAWVENKIASMTLPEKIGQMILTGVIGSELTSDTCQYIRRVSPGGVIYIQSNITSLDPVQLNELSQGLQNCINDAVGIPLLIAIDHEGPYATRFPAGSQMTTFPPAIALGATRQPEYAYQAASGSGTELRANGVNMVLGPVADVLMDFDNTVISVRSYGGDPQAVSQYVDQAVQGYIDAGVLPVLKHYPGHGSVSGDSHKILPEDSSDKDTLLISHLLPFQAGIDAGAPAVMVSHVAFPAVDAESNPASMSPELFTILDENLGFRGIAMSDSMGMGAVSSTGLDTASASIKAVNAGLDMIMLVSPDLAESVYSSVLWAAQSGEISEERINQAVRDILTVKFNHGLSTFSKDDEVSPDWQSNTNLAFEIGYSSVSLHKDDLGLLPLQNSAKSVLVVGPVDAWGLYPLLRSEFDRLGISYNILTYSNYWKGRIPETELIPLIPERAVGYDCVIVFTWDSHPNQFKFGDQFQSQLVKAVVDSGTQTMVVALKSPTDILDFPMIGTYLATMGTTRGQLHAMVNILVGDDAAAGKIPLPDLP